jgi:hypothetical protein
MRQLHGIVESFQASYPWLGVTRPMPCDSHEAANATKTRSRGTQRRTKTGVQSTGATLWAELSREGVSGADISQVHRDPSQVS